MTEAPVTTGRRRSCIGPENTYRAFDDEVPDYGMITIYHNDDPTTTTQFLLVNIVTGEINV